MDKAKIGIACPSCGSRDSCVVDTHKNKNRRRMCNGCGFRFNTEEYIVRTCGAPKFEKVPDVDKLLVLFEHKTVIQLASQFNTSRQRIHQLLSKKPDEFERVKQDKKTRFNEIITTAHTEGKLTLEIAKLAGVSYNTVTRYLNALGLEPNVKERVLLPTGCPKCETDHYALGYCKPCYERNRLQQSVT